MKKLIFLASSLLLCLCFAMPASAHGLKKKPKKKGKTEAFVVEKPVLASAADSTAYIFGLSQSRGLRAYMLQQLHIDSAYIDDFARGIMDRAAVDTTDKKAVAYSAGQQIGGQIEQMAASFSKDYYASEPGRSIDTRIVAAAILSGLYGQNEMSADSAMTKFRSIMSERQKVNQEALYGSNRADGEAFLAENKKKAGVITLPSGLQYKVLTQGTGPVPTAHQKVKVNYEGHLIDGTEFDSSYKRGQAATFQADQVIKGWTEALCRMPVGSKWELYIPQQLAYGERDMGQIKPYSALIFTVELLSIEEEARAAKPEVQEKPATTTGTKAVTRRKVNKKK